jgi:hypothetical protein
MTPDQLESARLACWTAYHTTRTSAQRRESQARLAAVVREQLHRQTVDSDPARTTTTPNAAQSPALDLST